MRQSDNKQNVGLDRKDIGRVFLAV
jgi:hypothetical protein